MYFTVIEKKTQEESLVYCFNKILVVHTFAAVLKKYDKAFCAPCTNKRVNENDDICLWTCHCCGQQFQSVLIILHLTSGSAETHAPPNIQATFSTGLGYHAL